MLMCSCVFGSQADGTGCPAWYHPWHTLLLRCATAAQHGRQDARAPCVEHSSFGESGALHTHTMKQVCKIAALLGEAQASRALPHL